MLSKADQGVLDSFGVVIQAIQSRSIPIEAIEEILRLLQREISKFYAWEYVFP